MPGSDLFAKVRQSCFSDPFSLRYATPRRVSLQSKQLQPDYESSHRNDSIGKVERMLKTLIISLEKELGPLNPRILESFVSTTLEKTLR
jgi:hypothetical protein